MSCENWIVYILPCLLLAPQAHARFIDKRLGYTELEIVETGVFNCSSTLDCPAGYCCTGLMVSAYEDLGLCKKYKNIGDRCMEKLFPGDMVCPCARGLTCTRDPFSEDGIHTCETVAIHQEPWAMFKEKM